MSLHYLIDGYNLLYGLPEMPPGSWEAKRDALISLLRQRAPHGRNQITVIFDSRQGSGDRGVSGEIQIIYTAGESADDWISEKVRSVSNPRILVIVTDDKGIHRMVHGTGSKVMGTAEFLRRGLSAPRPGESGPSVDQDAITEEMKKEWLDP